MPEKLNKTVGGAAAGIHMTSRATGPAKQRTKFFIYPVSPVRGKRSNKAAAVWECGNQTLVLSSRQSKNND